MTGQWTTGLLEFSCTNCWRERKFWFTAFSLCHAGLRNVDNTDFAMITVVTSGKFFPILAIKL
jgi:hypothetical protein